ARIDMVLQSALLDIGRVDHAASARDPCRAIFDDCWPCSIRDRARTWLVHRGTCCSARDDDRRTFLLSQLLQLSEECVCQRLLADSMAAGPADLLAMLVDVSDPEHLASGVSRPHVSLASCRNAVRVPGCTFR